MTKVLDNGVTRDATPEELAEIGARAALELTAAIAAAIAKTYADVDSIYTAAVGQRTQEYADAEAAARSFVVSGYSGSASEYVSDYALQNATGEVQTNAWAADQIIARADAFHAAKLAMRSARFARQAQMREATTAEELASAIGGWDDFIAATRAQLGL
ncbi:hypothetical protein ACFSQU_18160 [Massilia sp. GCM10020059]|uniref:Uncharacterized protein n=1 Tax=Massilia agrisoli TaxID=2892444 RepID=A0ABS8IS45_9BURK|nr:hypothetical protein [Massilia agrisoli]MCC6071467.1 hypothetical protein [Massilia agrisoli]